ncbi:hypothetical protein [Microbulbifer epialgicus]|uniref:Uncharacterized protein n=1 Tax=Microbulbifer epialgicus TaxID=393907 RepID=A0ABV4NTQ6_9GAMM
MKNKIYMVLMEALSEIEDSISCGFKVLSIGDQGGRVEFEDRYQLSVVPDGDNFELAIYGVDGRLAPELFDDSDNVHDVKRGSDTYDIHYYLKKLSSTKTLTERLWASEEADELTNQAAWRIEQLEVDLKAALQNKVQA